MNLKQLITVIAIVASVVASGCSHYTRVHPGALQPIFLPSQQTVTSGKRVITLPAGTYGAYFEDATGIYYRSPSAMIQTTPLPPGAFGPVAMHGGVFIPRAGIGEQQHAVWLFGAFSELSRLPTRMTIIKLNERVDFLEGPTKVYDIP